MRYANQSVCLPVTSDLNNGAQIQGSPGQLNKFKIERLTQVELDYMQVTNNEQAKSFVQLTDRVWYSIASCLTCIKSIQCQNARGKWCKEDVPQVKFQLEWNESLGSVSIFILAFHSQHADRQSRQNQHSRVHLSQVGSTCVTYDCYERALLEVALFFTLHKACWTRINYLAEVASQDANAAIEFPLSLFARLIFHTHSLNEASQLSYRARVRVRARIIIRCVHFWRK